MLAVALSALAFLTPLQPPGRVLTSNAQRCAPTTCCVVSKFFVERLGATEAEAKRASSRLLPSTRSALTQAQARHLCDTLQDRLGLSDAELKRFVLRLPPVLSLHVERNVLPSLTALQRRLELSEAELKKLILAFPPLLSLSVEANVEPSLAALQERLGLSAAELRRIVLARPQVLVQLQVQVPEGPQ